MRNPSTFECHSLNSFCDHQCVLLLYMTMTDCSGDLLESCSQYCLGRPVVGTHHSSSCNPRQVQSLPPHSDDIRSVIIHFWDLIYRHLKLCEAHSRLFLHAECLSLLTSASAVFSLILLCGVILMIGFLNLEYYTGEWQDTGRYCLLASGFILKDVWWLTGFSNYWLD